MGLKKKNFGKQEFEILDHEEVPGFRIGFYVVFTLAAVYFLYIFAHLFS